MGILKSGRLMRFGAPIIMSTVFMPVATLASARRSAWLTSVPHDDPRAEDRSHPRQDGHVAELSAAVRGLGIHVGIMRKRNDSTRRAAKDY